MILDKRASFRFKWKPSPDRNMWSLGQDKEFKKKKKKNPASAYASFLVWFSISIKKVRTHTDATKGIGMFLWWWGGYNHIRFLICDSIFSFSSKRQEQTSVISWNNWSSVFVTVYICLEFLTKDQKNTNLYKKQKYLPKKGKNRLYDSTCTY